ncbi:hypothetical protein Pmar_PMAR020409 [Perkinsus marinus ATCC 50983]|uniref:Uncharacterized protein n=1 Tax=Perkinsus marinus (strain ATCC 50983 / TXsc) TaxID=423536 RepID=C5L6Y8_PERM5|nr:hypothetical protein Pmar_PMAR020409 [Perkinsus marinus ATCC 50983]EER07250.1 hypothetical protein Pmar_PMAR020409 [Perkinsus marinus ATCC 50983]|eukprot:XP_002775434.1 hypothetical protein Pmar_PMAR020409 [Perkinsus marinus ATCC 50983]
MVMSYPEHDMGNGDDTKTTKSERTMSASTTADAGSPSALLRLVENRRPRRESEDSVKSKLELAIRRTSCSPLTNAGTKSAPDGTLLVYRTESMATAVKANAFLKTKMCPKLRMNANGVWTCPQGDRCSFAHSEAELRSLPNLTKTAICYEQVYGKCGCKNGARCKYAHSEEELRKYIPLSTSNSRSPGRPRHGSGDSVNTTKRKNSRASELGLCNSGSRSGRRYSKESVSSCVKTAVEPKPIDLPSLRSRALQIARELPASRGKHLEISRSQLVDQLDDPCIAQYMCSICGALASPTPDPTIASACAHMTCARCFEGWRRANVEQEPKLKTLPCPSCGCPLRKGIDVFPFNESVEGPIAALLRVYSKIRIRCQKVDELSTSPPCEWVGSVRDFPEHMVVCHHWECMLETLPSSSLEHDAGAANDGRPMQFDYGKLHGHRGTISSSAAADITPMWDDNSPSASPGNLLKFPSASADASSTGFNEQLLILSPSPVVDSHGHPSAAASASTATTITGALGGIWRTQQLDGYSGSSSNCSEMMTCITPEKVSLLPGSGLGEEPDDKHVEELALAECEVICDFIPYGSSADKMLEIFEGETLL